MQCITLARVFVVVSVCCLTGCDALANLAWLYVHDHQPGGSDAGEPEPAVGLELAPRKSALLDDGRLLTATTKGLQIFDLRDPAHPRAEGAYPLNAPEFYLEGNHVLLLESAALGYRGERDDLDLPRGRRTLGILNIDITDRAHPTLIERLDDVAVQDSFMRRGPQGSTLFVTETSFAMVSPLRGPYTRIHRYDLRDGKLVAAGTVDLDGYLSSFFASPTWLAAATTQGADGPHITVVDLSGPGLSVASRAPLASDVSVLKLALDGTRLRMLRQVGASTAVDTYDLSQPLTAGPSGHCEIFGDASPAFTASLFSEHDSALYLSDSAQLERIRFDAPGACLDRSSFGPGSYQLQEVAEHRLLGLGSETLSLYDTTSPDTAPALLSRAALATAYSGAELAERVIERVRLRTPAAAENGTREPWLVGLAYYGADPVGRFQLFTMSNQTLTARAAIADRGVPQVVTRASAAAGNAIVTLSNAQLRTFDGSDLNQLRELGQLKREEGYTEEFSFGQFRARGVFSPWYAVGVRDDAPTYDGLQTLPLDSDEPIAELRLAAGAIPALSSWSQVDKLMLNIDIDWMDAPSQYMSTAIQAYDLSDPTRPRRAGSFSSSEIVSDWEGPADSPSQWFSLLSVDHALVFLGWAGNYQDSTFAFDSVDMRDPDHLALRPRFNLLGDFVRVNYLARGSKLHVIERERAGMRLYGSVVDFSDFEHPTHSARREVPGSFVALTESAAYTHAAASGGFTISRIDWTTESSQLKAEHSWSDRRFAQALLDESTQRLYVLHAPLSSTPAGAPPRADWYHFDILDAQTLELLSSFEIDSVASTMQLSSDTLTIEIWYRWSLQVDVRDPQQPKLIGAFDPYGL